MFSVTDYREGTASDDVEPQKGLGLANNLLTKPKSPTPCSLLRIPSVVAIWKCVIEMPSHRQRVRGLPPGLPAAQGLTGPHTIHLADQMRGVVTAVSNVCIPGLSELSHEKRLRTSHSR